MAVDSVFAFALCVCGQRRLKTEVSCGQCPCRRASDDECNAAYDEGRELLRCRVCDSPIMPSVRPGYEPRATHISTPMCLECFKTRNVKTQCEYPRHKGDRYVPSHNVAKYAVLSQAKTTFGRYFKRPCCATCAVRHSLQTWDDYALSRGEIDVHTGEVKPLIQDTPELRLHTHPIEAFGGMRVCWCPKRGMDGAVIKREGFSVENVCVFKPLRFASFQWGSKRHRIIVATRIDTSDIGNFQGTVWHAGVNAWIDSQRELSGDSGLRQFGWIYARITGVREGSDKHTLAIASHETWLRDNEHKGTFAQWLQWCDALGTNQ